MSPRGQTVRPKEPVRALLAPFGHRKSHRVRIEPPRTDCKAQRTNSGPFSPISRFCRSPPPLQGDPSLPGGDRLSPGCMVLSLPTPPSGRLALEGLSKWGQRGPNLLFGPYSLSAGAQFVLCEICDVQMGPKGPELALWALQSVRGGSIRTL